MKRFSTFVPIIAMTLATSTLLAACIPQTASSPGSSAPAPPRASAVNEPRLPTDLIGLIEQEPVWNMQDVVANATYVAGGTYVVQSGDTLRGIGNRTGVGSEMLAKANGLVAPFTIFPGQRLTIMEGRYHLVAEGETGIAIARAYGADWSRIVDINGITEPYILRRGQRLLLPPEAPTRPMTMEERAAAFQIDIDDIVTGGQPASDEGAASTMVTTQPRPLPSKVPIAEPKSFAGSFIWPIEGSILSRFGPGASGQRNDGINIQAAMGTPIRAAADGVVAYAGTEIGVFGGLVLITHGDGFVTAYGHAGRVDVVRGQQVKRGQIIGLSGDSGYSAQPQLHFEIRKNRVPVNPVPYLPPRT